jgi:hypothetical protein
LHQQGPQPGCLKHQYWQLPRSVVGQVSLKAAVYRPPGKLTGHFLAKEVFTECLFIYGSTLSEK